MLRRLRVSCPGNWRLFCVEMLALRFLAVAVRKDIVEPCTYVSEPRAQASVSEVN
jgi:hypothetical protein